MALALVTLGGSVGGLLALAALLTVGLGPVVALLIIWAAAVATSLVLAIVFVRSTVLMAMSSDVATLGPESGEDL